MTEFGTKLISAAEEGVAQGRILQPGTFKVSDYRKAIPDWVKIVCAMRALAKEFENFLNGKQNGWPAGIKAREVEWVRALRFDHRPALQDRPYDLDAGDFIPPQNDPDHIEAIPSAHHDERTFGRKPGAEKTVTTRGSDIGEAKRTRHIQDNDAIRRAKIASRDGDFAKAAEILATVKNKGSLKPKRRIRSRGFDKRHRPMRSRRFG